MLQREKKREQLLFRMFNNGELVHPVHEGMTLFDDTLEFATDTGDQFITGKKVCGIDGLLLGSQKVGLDTVLLELNTVDKPAFFKFLDNPGTFPAVDTELFPELALEYPFGF